MDPVPPKPVVWLGRTRDELREFPRRVRKEFGFALWLAQRGSAHPKTKTLHGFDGGGVIEIVQNASGNAYRTVYTVRWSGVIYVLHVFQKKSTRGIKTPLPDRRLIDQRFREAKQDYERRIAASKKR